MHHNTFNNDWVHNLRDFSVLATEMEKRYFHFVWLRIGWNLIVPKWKHKVEFTLVFQK
jgi:hypothetical protein